MKEVEKFEDLELWHVGMELVQEIYGLTDRFPIEEKPGMVGQMRTAAIKIPSKIAASVGCGNNIKISLWYLAISLGLLSSLETYIELSVRLKYIPKAEADPILEKCKLVEKMINELILS